MQFFNLISLYLLTVTVAVVYNAVHVRNLSRASYTTTAIHLAFAVCFYILGYTMELNSATPAQILFWNRIEYIGIPFVSALWLTTALIYTGHFSRYKKSLIAAIYIIPVMTFLLRLTNDYHHLYFKSIRFVTEHGHLSIVKEMGPFNYVQMFHSASMVIVAMGLLVHDSLKAPYRQPGKIVLVTASSLFAIAGLYLSASMPAGFRVDYMALFLPVTCITVIMAISRYDLLETRSIARSKVFESSSDAILMMNLQDRVLDCNDSAKALFEALGIRTENGHIRALFAGRDELLAALEGTEPSIVKLKTGGGERYFEITTERIGEGDLLRGWIKIFRDVTGIYQLNEELSRLAMTDELSVLSNRRAFMKIGREWLERSQAEGTPLHLLMLDLDYFKFVNDRYGHPTGDLVIHEFSQLLKAHFGEHSLIARLGGEEFAVMVPGLDDDAVLRLIDSMLTQTENHTYSFFGNKFHVTVSVGVTALQPDTKLETMMRRADRALYRSKDKGRCCVTVQ